MLVLSRKPGEQVQIGQDITFVLLEVNGNRARIGITAPAHIRIARQELGPLPLEPDVCVDSQARETDHAIGHS